MNRIILISFLLLIAGAGKSQTLVGYHSDDIKKIMRETQNEFRLNDNTKNEYYNYLKFENRFGTKTFLFFLSENDTCTYTKMMCDYSNLKVTLEMLNEKYQLVNENKWIEEKNGDKFNITLKRENWYFTLVTRRSK
ncbi:MAG: hypothetical protein KAT40_03730 [Bacteroidales bacterium]|nr:hypothetical protein [Bacteroidales bacterium]